MGWNTAAVRPLPSSARWLVITAAPAQRDGRWWRTTTTADCSAIKSNGCSHERFLPSPSSWIWRLEGRHQLHQFTGCRALYHLWDYYFPATLSALNRRGLLHDLYLPVRPVSAHQAAKAARTGHHSGKPTLPQSNSRAVFVTEHSCAACFGEENFLPAQPSGAPSDLSLTRKPSARLCAMLFDCCTATTCWAGQRSPMSATVYNEKLFRLSLLQQFSSCFLFEIWYYCTDFLFCQYTVSVEHLHLKRIFVKIMIYSQLFRQV